MKFTLSWLREHLDTTATVDQVVEAMTMAGLEVEHVDDPVDGWLVPAGQLVQAGAAAPAYWPVPPLEQRDAPVLAWYVPVAQLVQAMAA
jgi:hypothetical protein